MKATHLKKIALSFSAQPRAEGARDAAILKTIALSFLVQHGAEGARKAAVLKTIALSFLGKKEQCKAFLALYRRSTGALRQGPEIRARSGQMPTLSGPTLIVYRIAVRDNS